MVFPPWTIAMHRYIGRDIDQRLSLGTVPISIKATVSRSWYACGGWTWSQRTRYKRCTIKTFFAFRWRSRRHFHISAHSRCTQPSLLGQAPCAHQQQHLWTALYRHNEPQCLAGNCCSGPHAVLLACVGGLVLITHVCLARFSCFSFCSPLLLLPP